MADGDVIVTVRAVNNAMEESSVAIQVGVDTQRPVCDPIVIGSHEPGHQMVYTDEVDGLHARWSCIDAAPWSHKPLSCLWAIGSFPGGDDLMEWTAASRNGTHSFACDACLDNGVLYFVSVRCSDQVGLSTLVTSSGLMPVSNWPGVLPLPLFCRGARVAASLLSYSPVPCPFSSPASLTQQSAVRAARCAGCGRPFCRRACLCCHTRHRPRHLLLEQSDRDCAHMGL